MTTVNAMAAPPAATINALRQVDRAGFLKSLCLLAILLFGAYLGVLYLPGPGRLLCQFAAGLLLAHGVELVHQCLHKTGFGAISQDHAVGVVLSWPVGISFFYYLWLHHWHHVQNGSEMDAESFAYTYQMMEHPSRTIRFLGLLRHLSMVDHFAAALRRMGLALTGRLAADLTARIPTMHPHYARRIQREYRGMAAAISIVVALSAAFGLGGILLNFWLIPVLFWAPAHALIELPEHWDTAPRPNRRTFDNTRTIRAGRFARWLTNGNCFHVEHHEHPGVPMQRLEELHALLVAGNGYRHLDDSYPQFFIRFFRTLWNGPGR